MKRTPLYIYRNSHPRNDHNPGVKKGDLLFSGELQPDSEGIYTFLDTHPVSVGFTYYYWVTLDQRNFRVFPAKVEGTETITLFPNNAIRLQLELTLLADIATRFEWMAGAVSANPIIESSFEANTGNGIRKGHIPIVAPPDNSPESHYADDIREFRFDPWCRIPGKMPSAIEEISLHIFRRWYRRVGE